jgi:Gpi18-like mannosyltransferase
MTKSFYWFTGLLLILIPLGFLFMPKGGFEGDLTCWVRWARSIQLTGFQHAYSNPEIVYHPFYLSMLYLYGLIYPGEDGLIQHLTVLKAMIFIFDLAGIFILGWALDKNKISPWKALLVLVCPAYFYNTICWGQVDSIHSTFCFAAVMLAVYRRPYFSIAMYVLALSMKFQAVIFLPVLLILWWPYMFQSSKFLIRGIALMGILFLMMLAPFLLVNQASNFLNVITVAINYFPFASLHAYNLWYLLFPFKDPMYIPDAIKFLGISYKTWGHILYLTGTLAALFPLFKFVFKNLKAKNSGRISKMELEIILLCCTLIPMIFFFFNTQMHERYAHPAIIFAGTYALFSRKYLIFILLSVAMVLNLEGLIYYFQLPQQFYKTSIIFNPQLVAIIYFAAISLGLISLYKVLRQNEVVSE